jgi:hypothetical protein
MMSTVPRPDAIVHDVAMFLLYPPQPEAAGREEWERARAAIAQLANDQCAAASPPPRASSLPANVVRLFPRQPREWTGRRDDRP